MRIVDPCVILTRIGNTSRSTLEEGVCGSLTPGKYADIVVLSQDLLTIPEEDIPDTEVDITIVGGKVRYERGMGGSK